jgi:uncharacterized Tic20 family protein
MYVLGAVRSQHNAKWVKHPAKICKKPQYAKPSSDGLRNRHQEHDINRRKQNVSDFTKPDDKPSDMKPEVKIPVTPADEIQGVEVPYVNSSNVQSEEEVDRIVQEYENKYRSVRRERIEIPEPDEKPKNDFKNDHKDDYKTFNDYGQKWRGKMKVDFNRIAHDLRPSSVNATTSEEERTWAAVAHGSALLTLILGLSTGGLAALLTLFIPLGIYFMYRQRSEYVANQALQSFAMQVLCTVGVVFTAVALALAATLVTLILAITIVGIIAIPFLWLAVALVFVALMALPLGMGILGTLGAFEAWQGRLFRYPYIANWIDEQMHGGFLQNI